MSLSSKISAVILALLTAITLSACNTIGGMGEDIEAAGKGIDNTAENTKEKM